MQEEQVFCFWLVLDISGLAEVQVMKSEGRLQSSSVQIGFVLVERIRYIKNHFLIFLLNYYEIYNIMRLS